jgi:hypothetical protein
MSHERLGVHCKFCGQPVVLPDISPDSEIVGHKLSGPVVLRCVSCGGRASYAMDTLQGFVATEIASGDWVPIPRAGAARAAPGRRGLRGRMDG